MEKSEKRRHKWAINKEGDEECKICGTIRINVFQEKWKIYNYVLKETGEIRTKLQCLNTQYKLEI
jgi:hypothetical protein